MKIEVIPGYPIEGEGTFSVLLTNKDGQRFEIACWNKSQALALEARIAGSIDALAIDYVEDEK